MSKSWKDFVKKEFVEADKEFVNKLPLRSIDLSTFGLISEAATFIPVETKEGIRIKPLTEGLSGLKEDIKNSSHPAGDFDLKSAEEVLAQFARRWEKEIRQKDKWERMVELANEENQVISQEEYEQRTAVKDSWIDKIKSLLT